MVASNRGRSHAHEGKFRDDDFKVASLNGTGWSIVAVADGAGGSKYSRKGSFIACNAAVQYFQEKLSPDEFVELESVIVANGASNTEDTGKALSALVMATWVRRRTTRTRALPQRRKRTGQRSRITPQR
ncbi:MAG: protein phosphatase 2C domain-containing protein [Flavobacteriales bacterium]|nr:protein phosphatase 2C domain-containing protein [Flavobacteriales bacterium]